MPQEGFYFDSISRQAPIDEEHLNPEDNLEEFGPVTENTFSHFRARVEALEEGTDRAILANFGGTGFGDIALVPVPGSKVQGVFVTSKSGTSAPLSAAIMSTRFSRGSAKLRCETWRKFTRSWETEWTLFL